MGVVASGKGASIIGTDFSCTTRGRDHPRQPAAQRPESRDARRKWSPGSTGRPPMPVSTAIVFIGAGKAFSSGADIREFNTPKAAAEPTLRSVIRIVEDQPQAGHRGHRRHLHGRRTGAGAGMPLPRRIPRRQDRVARSEAGAAARRGRHAAPAARDRRGGRVEHDRFRRACAVASSSKAPGSSTRSSRVICCKVRWRLRARSSRRRGR